MSKSRLDVLLVELGHFETRAKAHAAILAGEVEVDGQVSDKAGHSVKTDAKITLRKRPKWVSRGAEKLYAAFERFGLDCAALVCLDVGAGSGGFTQVMLERGAARVYAVDVGYGQFDTKFRSDPRVVLLERKNARELSAKDIPEPVQFFSMDVSFISIFKILPAIKPLLSTTAAGAILFKPNFEARREEVKKGGLLLDPQIHRRLLQGALEQFPQIGFSLLDLTPSPIRGGDGNVEYLLYVRCDTTSSPRQISSEKCMAAVDDAFGRP